VPVPTELQLVFRCDAGKVLVEAPARAPAHWDQVHHTAKAVALMASSKKPGDVRKAYDQMMIGVSDSKRACSRRPAKKRKRRRAPAPAPARAPAPAVPVPAPAAPPPGTLDEGWGITPLNFAALESLLS